jgi:transposase
MAWTEITREQYRRDELRYASDTRAGEWAQIAPFLPARGRLGRPRERDLRTIVDAILYLLDAGKRIKGRKRHIVTDTQGFLLAVLVHEANIQDPHGAVPLLRSLRQTFPSLRHVFADRVYRGPQLQGAIADCGPWTMQIVERPPGVKGFQLLPRRWVVERTFAWFGRSRRLAKDFEATIASATAWVLLANLRLLSRRLAGA